MMHYLCLNCAVKLFYDEFIVSSEGICFSDCWKSRKIMFAPPRKPPELMEDPLMGQSLIERQFCQNVRKCGTAFTITSAKAKWDGHAPGLSKYRPTITVHGQLFHLIVTARSLSELPPKFMSIYFYEPDNTEQATLELGYDSNLNIFIAKELEKMSHEGNQYVNTFSMLPESVGNDTYPISYHMVIHVDKISAS